MAYEPVRGASVWVDARGSGDPVVLLHGGMSDSGEFEGNLCTLADTYRVVGYDRRGFGRTADTGEFTMEEMASDAAAVVESVGPAHLVGYSAGGMVAAALTIRRPELVRSVVLISTALRAEDWVVRPQVAPGGRSETGYPPAVVDRYAALSPDGRAHFPVLVRKVAALASEDVAAVDALSGYPGRVLVVTADDDLVTLESQVALYRTLLHGELAVIPGTSHALLLEKPGLVTSMVRTFLTDEPLPTSIPIRRASAATS